MCRQIKVEIQRKFENREEFRIQVDEYGGQENDPTLPILTYRKSGEQKLGRRQGAAWIRRFMDLKGKNVGEICSLQKACLMSCMQQAFRASS